MGCKKKVAKLKIVKDGSKEYYYININGVLAKVSFDIILKLIKNGSFFIGSFDFIFSSLVEEVRNVINFLSTIKIEINIEKEKIRNFFIFFLNEKMFKNFFIFFKNLSFCKKRRLSRNFNFSRNVHYNKNFGNIIEEGGIRRLLIEFGKNKDKILNNKVGNNLFVFKLSLYFFNDFVGKKDVEYKSFLITLELDDKYEIVNLSWFEEKEEGILNKINDKKVILFDKEAYNYLRDKINENEGILVVDEVITKKLIQNNIKIEDFCFSMKKKETLLKLCDIFIFAKEIFTPEGKVGEFILSITNEDIQSNYKEKYYKIYGYFVLCYILLKVLKKYF